MFENDFCEFIERIDLIHRGFSKAFKDDYKEPYNFRKFMVCDAIKDQEFLSYVLSYTTQCSCLVMDFDLFPGAHWIRSKVKNPQSIQQKLQTYMDKSERGAVYIYKCLNDLMGIRLICDLELCTQDIQKILTDHGIEKKCIDSSKGDYKATHIYFNIGNKAFQWELQVWNIKDMKQNELSHYKYKQNYKDWSMQQEGGRILNND